MVKSSVSPLCCDWKASDPTLSLKQHRDANLLIREAPSFINPPPSSPPTYFLWHWPDIHTSVSFISVHLSEFLRDT